MSFSKSRLKRLVLQVRNQIDAMQLYHDHKRMMLNNASAAFDPGIALRISDARQSGV
jgi:hypothetical protein